ncbi:MAG: TSUP family transporter [Bacteroidetes bacterium]|jgi:uncharacterized membrane protein YfcA|nr:TSUP family transporter [Bacteroidota bacterium]
MLFEFWYMLPVAILIATIAMGSGVEGATFFSPFFILVLGLDPTTAIGTGLVTEVFGFSSGLFAYYKRQLIDYHMGAQILAVSVPAALLGTWAAHFIADDVLKAILGMGLVAVAFSFLRSPDESTKQTLDAQARQRPERAERCLVTADGERICYRIFNKIEGLLAGGVGGTFIGMLSTGLGELNGYLFLQRCRIPSGVAVATSVFIVAVTALTASVSHVAQFAQAGPETLATVGSLLCFTVPGVLIGGQLGPIVARRIPDRTLELVMGGLFFLIAGVLLVEVAWA